MCLYWLIGDRVMRTDGTVYVDRRLDDIRIWMYAALCIDVDEVGFILYVWAIALRCGRPDV